MTAASPPGRSADRRLLAVLSDIVGRRHCLTSDAATKPFRTGYRTGSGTCLAVVRPGTLLEQWRVVQACVAADVIILMQAANTGLTGGSTPDEQGYDRDVVIVSTLRLTGIHLIDQGRQVVCLPGATLYDLERRLKPLGREPHSVIGSSCIGASVLGGVCNNSGGALVKRGPAFTELAVFAQLGADGVLRLVNHLGIALGTDPEEVLMRLEAGRFDDADIAHDPRMRASDPDYAVHVRDTDATTPARFNADPRRLFEGSGSAGRIVLFAVRLDTFETETDTAVICVGVKDPDGLTAIRRALLLAPDQDLPVAAEYIHRDAFRIAERYGKDTVLAIRLLGTDRLPALFRAKNAFDALVGKLPFAPAHAADRLLQAIANGLPPHLPPRFRDFGHAHEHLLMIRLSAADVARTVERLTPLAAAADGAVMICSRREGDLAFLHRFATAGAAVRYRTVHHKRVADVLALDIALPRNTTDWFETLPAAFDAALEHRLYYGHFLCQVFHQDYIVRTGWDVMALEHRMWAILDERGAEYPAEHNVGHLYPAKPRLASFYRELDPCNAFNPGIGHTSRTKGWSA